MVDCTPAHIASADKQRAENANAPPAGTALAIYTITPSCSFTNAGPPLAAGIARTRGTANQPVDLRIPRACEWGGVRNRKDRVSHNLTRQQVQGMMAAGEFSSAIKRPFQRHWTVHYERGGIDDRDGATFVSRLLKIVGQAARRAGGEMTALWVRENGDAKGAHVHILLHLPDGMSLHGRTRRWLRLAGLVPRARVSKVRTIGRKLNMATVNPALYTANTGRVRAYQFKGASEQAGSELFLARFGEGGRVIGKRCGWTQNIGQRARKNEPSIGASFETQ